MKFQHRLHRKKNQGFTLIEILVAMFIGLFLIAGILQIFINSKQSYRTQEALARLQESGRFALDFLDHDIRMAGYRGCSSINTKLVNNLSNTTGYRYDFSKSIQGFDTTAGATAASWTPSHNSSTTGINLPLTGSDIITIRRAGDDSVPIAGNDKTTKTLSLSRDSQPKLKACDLVIVSDCENADLFQITGYAGDYRTVSYNTPGCSSVGNAKVMQPAYKNGNLHKAQTISYYISQNANNQPALYRLLNETVDELVEGVEKMQVYYGVDKDGSGAADSYVTAADVANWDQVISVKISLLLRTLDDNIASTQLKYSYEDIDNQIAPDRRLRRVFTTTIALRNKLR
jgi:type IV pilus assembly protein PilW